MVLEGMDDGACMDCLWDSTALVVGSCRQDASDEQSGNWEIIIVHGAWERSNWFGRFRKRVLYIWTQD